MSKEERDFIKKNENNGNFYSIAYFVYYKLQMVLVLVS